MNNNDLPSGYIRVVIRCHDYYFGCIWETSCQVFWVFQKLDVSEVDSLVRQAGNESLFLKLDLMYEFLGQFGKYLHNLGKKEE